MSPDGSDRRPRSPQQRERAWAEANPVRAGVIQGVVFGIVIGIISALNNHRSLGADVIRGAIAGVIFGVLMWALATWRRRRRVQRG